MPDLASDAIHVWRVDVLRFADQPGTLARTLSEDEKARADRFFFEADRRNFLLRRAILRKLIAGYLCILPNEVAFRYTSVGQPVLADARFRHLKFSLTHSGDLVLIAVAQNLQIGVDVELERTFNDMTAIVRRYFSPEEQLEFFALPAADQLRAFYCGWTRKEAFLKAIGQGVAFGLNNITVTLNPNEPARLVSLHEGRVPVPDWSLYSFIPLPGYAGALAVEGNGHHVACWQLASDFITQP
jgi:4'-phosphopantetheinyl transferase